MSNKPGSGGITGLDRVRVGAPLPNSDPTLAVGTVDCDRVLLRDSTSAIPTTANNLTLVAATLSGDVTVTIPAVSGTLLMNGAPASGNLDMNGNLILNIGNAGTDFTAGGGLTLATGLTYVTSVDSVTALATPGAYAATEGTLFASTVSGATLMGFGTTGDVTLKNRAGTDVLVVTANTTSVTMAGQVTVAGNLVMSAAAAQVIPGATSYSVRNSANTLDDLIVFAGGSVGIRGTLGVGFSTAPTGNGINVGAASTNNAISTASQGAGTTALWIGNAQITAVSDVRLKDHIVPSTVDAVALLKQLALIDHSWNDPADVAPVNRNTRGLWKAQLSAQQMVDIVPWLINAPDRTCVKCKAGQVCDVHTTYWQVDLAYMAGLFTKAVQQLDARLIALGG